MRPHRLHPPPTDLRRTMTSPAAPVVLISEAEIAQRVQALADQIAPRIDDDTVAVCLLTGGLWFAADLTRALWKAGRNVRFDALWLASYGDARASLGRCEVRADLQRPLAGRTALIVDDVFDTGPGAKAPAPAKAMPRAAVAINAGPAIVEAKPLPPGSPDALPPHD